MSCEWIIGTESWRGCSRRMKTTGNGFRGLTAQWWRRCTRSGAARCLPKAIGMSISLSNCGNDEMRECGNIKHGQPCRLNDGMREEM